MTELPPAKRRRITVAPSASLEAPRPTCTRQRRGGCRVAAVIVGVLVVLAAACSDSESGRLAYPQGAPPSMAELDCARSDGENSTTIGRPPAGEFAADPDDALEEFATTGLLDLDDPAGVLEVVRRDSARARAEYRVGDATRAVLLVANEGGWWVDAVAWCSELETTTTTS